MSHETQLAAPCRWCGYNGENYWQAGTHAKTCPWLLVGGEAARKALLAASPPAADTGLREELGKLCDKWRERAREQVDTAHEAESKGALVTAAGLHHEAEARQECADELQGLLARVSGQPVGEK